MREPVDWSTEDLLAHRVRATPERTALIDADRGEEWSYRSLHSHAGWQAKALAYRGVDPGDTLGMLVSPGISFVDLVHAALGLRATLVPLNVELPAPQLADQADRADLDWLICESETEGTAVELLDPEQVYSVHTPEHGATGKLDRPTAPLGDLPPIERDRTVLVLFTSGTTGEPKGVRLTAGNLVASATASAFRLGVDPDDRWLVPLPTYHMGGLAPLVRSTLYGTAVVLQREFDAEATAQTVAEHEVTGVSLVPTMLTRLLDAGWKPPDSLRFALVGGAPTPVELVERCRKQGVPVHPSYGATEAASQIATATPEQAFEKPGTVGQPLLFTDVAVVGEDDERLARGETGELVVDGPTVSPGYLDGDGEVFCDRGLRTGDLGYRDEDGLLWVVGRTDDAIVTGGETVHPSTVVDALRDHGGVAEAAVVGLEDPEWGQRVGALVVPADESVDLADLREHCRGSLAGFEVPKNWAVADSLPRTASATVDREAVRRRLREE